MKAFKEDDPNQSGQDDTYGIVISKYEGPWDIMQTWFGVPNQWGETGNGELIPDFMTEEYLEALSFFKKLYDEGLVNEDFAVMDTAEWVTPINNGEAGVLVDVADQANRTQEKLLERDSELEGVIDVFGAVKGPHGLRTLPTAGYMGMFAIPKTTVKTEEELREVLRFIDMLNDEEAQIIANNGLEGRHFEMTESGEFKQISAETPALYNEHQDLNQLQPYIPENRFYKEEMSPLIEKQEVVMKANEKIVVPNPAEALISDVYSQKGAQLDNIINDARIQFIVGQIDEDGLQEAISLWLSSGGQEYIDEINQLYQEAGAE